MRTFIERLALRIESATDGAIGWIDDNFWPRMVGVLSGCVIAGAAVAVLLIASLTDANAGSRSLTRRLGTDPAPTTTTESVSPIEAFFIELLSY